jgi:hypothetical protein
MHSFRNIFQTQIIYLFSGKINLNVYMNLWSMFSPKFKSYSPNSLDICVQVPTLYKNYCYLLVFLHNLLLTLFFKISNKIMGKLLNNKITFCIIYKKQVPSLLCGRFFQKIKTHLIDDFFCCSAVVRVCHLVNSKNKLIDV